jgi:radical SAM superfamily enzyme YgiQ (UPF0313 family)
MHLVLINPLSKKSGMGGSKNSNIPPLSLSFIAAATPSNYRITIIDENMETCAYPDADLVGITGYTSAISRGYQIASKYREKGVPVVMGGIHVSMLPDEALRYCDSVVTGEAETIWPTVLKDFDNGALKPIYEGCFTDITSLPIPRRDLLKPNYTWGTLQTSRGCPMACNFCSVTVFNGRQFRRRLMDDVISELQQIKQRFIFLIDDNILGFNKEDRNWLFEFFKRVQKLKPKKYFLAQSSIQIGEDPELLRLANKAGVKTLFVGMESVEGQALESFNKILNASMLKKNKYYELIKTIRKCGIGVLGAFILGGDTDTISSFKTTYDFILKSGIDVVQMTKPTPLPGTKFYEMLDSEKRIMNKNYPSAWDDYRFTRMLFKPHNLSVRDVYEGFAWLKIKFWSWPVKTQRYLRTLFDTKDIITVIMVIKLNNAYEVAFRSSEIFDDYSINDLEKKFDNK